MVITFSDFTGAQVGDDFSVPASWASSGPAVATFSGTEMIIPVVANNATKSYVTQVFPSTIGEKLQVRIIARSCINPELFVTENLTAPPVITIASDTLVSSGQDTEIVIQFTATQTFFAAMITASPHTQAVFDLFSVNREAQKTLTTNAQQFLAQEASVTETAFSVDGTVMYTNFTREDEEISVETGYIDSPNDIPWDDFFSLVEDSRNFTYDDLSLSAGVPVNPITVRMNGGESKTFIGPVENKVSYAFNMIKVVT